MVLKPTVTLPNKWINESERYGLRVVNGYSDGRNPESLSVSSRGAEKNVALQAHARMAECAGCLHFGLDPTTALDWSQFCDNGYDFIYAGVRWDVKATRNGHYLIWPVNKRDIFDSKQFDDLILIRGVQPTFTIAGFILKSVFREEHRVAGGGHVLDRGTWYMDEEDLWAT
jgi:hypothetical protein